MTHGALAFPHGSMKGLLLHHCLMAIPTKGQLALLEKGGLVRGVRAVALPALALLHGAMGRGRGRHGGVAGAAEVPGLLLQYMFHRALVGAVTRQAIPLRGRCVFGSALEQVLMATETELFLWVYQQLRIGRRVMLVAIEAGTRFEGWMQKFLPLARVMAGHAQTGDWRLQKALAVGRMGGVTTEALAILHGWMGVLCPFGGGVAIPAKPGRRLHQVGFALGTRRMAGTAIAFGERRVLLVAKHPLGL